MIPRHTTLISTTALASHVAGDSWVVVDCRFSLDDPERGRRDYLQAHIPGAIYGHLEEDLSGPIVPGTTGRHPLPAMDTFARTLSRWGIDGQSQVVVYDDSTGGMAARLWWMLRWAGHEAAAVLDGGWAQWRREGHPVASRVVPRAERRFLPRPRPELVLQAADVLEHMHDPAWRLIDARAPERYRGEQEPIDPVAGHIPGAICGSFAENLGPDGRFRTPDELRERYEALLDGVEAEHTIFYCGSGVTAAHNALAMAHAGLGDARLYAGSWSEWIVDPQRPVERG